jgi:hypothetical protein
MKFNDATEVFFSLKALVVVLKLSLWRKLHEVLKRVREQGLSPVWWLSDKLVCLWVGPKILQLRLETSLKAQASDWLKWRPVAISANQLLEI